MLANSNLLDQSEILVLVTLPPEIANTRTTASIVVEIGGRLKSILVKQRLVDVPVANVLEEGISENPRDGLTSWQTLRGCCSGRTGKKYGTPEDFRNTVLTCQFPRCIDRAPLVHPPFAFAEGHVVDQCK